MSPAIGGIVVGYEIGRQLGIEAIFAERSGGKLILRRGFLGNLVAASLEGIKINHIFSHNWKHEFYHLDRRFNEKCKI